jgi:hypothetical protein
MSSWANRNIPRKRDLSQIPSELRPQILPRYQQPQVILSETFQQKQEQKQENEIVYPDHTSLSKPVPERYNFKKVETKPSPLATLLVHNDKSYVFVILRNIQSTKDNDLWISSYNSIRKFYTNPIVIIDDNSTINTVNGRLVDTEVIKSDWRGAGEILPYYYFLKEKWADRMIFLHDSMFLHRPFQPSELEGSIRFHWHFDHEDRNDRKILSLLSLLHESNELCTSFSESTFQWKGCFGGASMIDLDVVEQLEQKYEFISKLISNIRTRNDRKAFERIFGIVAWYEHLIDSSTSSNFGSILAYPKAFESQHNNIETAAHIVSQANYNTSILKVWRGR